MPAEEKIKSYIDTEAAKKETDIMVGFIETLIKKFDEVNAKTITLSNVKGFSDFKKEVKETVAAVNDYSNVAKLAIDQQGKLVTTIKQGALNFEQQRGVLDRLGGSLDENIRLQVQYKVRLEEIGKELKILNASTNTAEKYTKSYQENVAQLVAEQLNLKTANQELSVTVRNQIKENQAAEGSIDQLQARMNQLQQVYEQLSGEEQKSPYGVSLKNSIEALLPVLKESEGGIGKFGRNVGNYAGSFKGAFEVLQNELTDVSAKLSQLGESDAGFAELQEQQGLLLKLTEGLNKEYSSTKGELRALSEAAQQLALAWGQNNEKVQEFISVVGGVKDDLGDVQESIKLAASDTKGFDNLINAAEGVGGAFAVAEGATALFGAENEELQKTFTKLTAITTILNGLQAIQNELKRKDSIFTGVQIAAQKAYTIAVGTSTGAMKALRLAIAATGIGLLIIGITTLLPKIQEWIGNTEDNKDAQEDFNNALEKQNDLLDQNLKGIEYVGKVREARAKIAGKGEKELAEIERKSNEDRLAAYKENVAAAENLAASIKGTDEESLKAKQSANKNIIDANRKYLDEISKQDIAAVEKQAKAAEDARKKQQEASIKAAERAKELRQKDLQAGFELEKLKIAQSAFSNKNILDNEENAYLLRVDAGKRFFEDQVKLIELEKKQSLSNKQLTKKEIAVIEQEARFKSVQAETEYLKQIQALNKEHEDKLKSEKEKAEADKAALIESRVSSGEKAIQQRQLRDQELLNNALISLNKQYLAGDFKNYEDYVAAKEKLIEESAVRSVENQIAAAEKLLDIEGLTFEQRQKFETDLSNLRKELTDAQIEREKKATDKTKENEQKKREEFIKTLEEIKQVSDAVAGAIESVLTGNIERQKNAVQEQMDDIDRQKAAEIDAANASALTQQEKADKIATINAVAQNKKEALERRQRELDQRKAQTERAFQVFSIIGNTAMAVTKFLAQGNIPGAVVAGVVGAAQLVATLAQPIPKYAKGRDGGPAEFAIVGEEGTERIDLPDGTSTFTPNKPSLAFLPEGASVIPHHQTMMDTLAAGSLVSMANASGNAVHERDFDFAYLQVVEKKLDQVIHALTGLPSKMPQTHLTPDGLGGYKKRTKNLNGWIEYEDQYFIQ